VERKEPIWCQLYRKEVMKPEQKKRLTEQRGRTKESQSGFYNTKEWKVLRSRFIKENPICCECEKRGKIRYAEVVDHIKAIDEYPELNLEYTNLQSLCNYHHIRKTNNDKRLKNEAIRLQRGTELMKKFETK